MPRGPLRRLTKAQVKSQTRIFVKQLRYDWSWDEIAAETRQRGHAELEFLVALFPNWYPNWEKEDSVQYQINRAWWMALRQVSQEHGLKVVQRAYGDPGVTFLALLVPER